MQTNTISVNESMRELTQHGSVHFPIQYYVDELYRFPGQAVPLHWHPELEFFVANKGRIHVQIGKSEFLLEDGFGLFVNANVLHGFKQTDAASHCQCPNIVFLDELIAPAASLIYQNYILPVTMNPGLPYIVLDPSHVWQREILTRLDRIFSLLQKYGPHGAFGRTPYLPFQSAEEESCCFELKVQEQLNQIWQILYTHQADIPSIPFTKTEHLLQIRTQKMLSFIQENYKSPLSLKEIASFAGISKSEASRCFQAYLHTSPVQYLISFRIEKAKWELLHSMDTLETISQKCGFSSASYFCKMFRRMTGMTAQEFRKQSAGLSDT